VSGDASGGAIRGASGGTSGGACRGASGGACGGASGGVARNADESGARVGRGWRRRRDWDAGWAWMDGRVKFNLLIRKSFSAKIAPNRILFNTIDAKKCDWRQSACFGCCDNKLIILAF
jgi:hypothetical protein